MSSAHRPEPLRPRANVCSGVGAGRRPRLRIHLDTRYPRIVAETEVLLARCWPFSPVGRQHKDGGSCAVVGVYSNHLPCLLSQHGPGKKHERPIVLEPWPSAIVERHPWELLRGLIWSDGCRFANRTGRYTYDSYAFTNLSAGIIDLFAAACARVGAACRAYPPSVDPARKGMVRVNRREAVSLFDALIGPKT